MPIASFDFPNPHVWLENNNFTQVVHTNNTGRIGQYARSASNGYTEETYMKFDVSALIGTTVSAVELDIVATTKGTNTNSVTSILYEQNKTNPTSLNDPVEFDDFAQTLWDTTLSSVTVQDTGTYTYPTSSALVACVQSWIDNPADNWGMIIDANFENTVWWLGLDSTQTVLRVTYISPSTNTILYDTPGSRTFSVPENVTSITAKLWAAGAGGGAGGDAGVGGDGGGGGFVQGDISVTPLESLDIHIGGAGGSAVYGGSSSGGGGGGGGKTLFCRNNSALLVAGGGGGGGGGDNSSATQGGAGGVGGGNTGGSGGNSSSSIGAGGGTQIAGGAAGSGGANVGDDGLGPNALNFGNCLDFDGSPESVNLGNDSVFNLTNNFTLECWIKPTSLASMRAIGSRTDDTANGIGLGINASGNIVFTTFGHQDFTSTVTVSALTWTHIAVVFTSGNDARFFKNGVFSNQVNGSTPATTTGIDMHIGQMGDDAQYWIGQIDEVRMWNTVRSDAQIAANYARELAGTETNLVGYWMFDESSGTNAPDETANDNDGTLLNMEDADWVTNDLVPPISTGAGGDGADGTDGDPAAKGDQANGGITYGAPGGSGDFDIGAPGYAGGGGGGAGLAGGGGGAGSVASDAGGSGGGGGSNYINPSALNTTSSQAVGQTPPNTGDPDYIGTVGEGGDGGATSSTSDSGSDGLLVLSFEGASAKEWGQPSPGDINGTHTDIKSMGGTSPKIDSMTATHLWYYSYGSGTLTIALYTGGVLTNAQGATRIAEAHNISVVAGWNQVKISNVSWPKDTVTWIAWAKSAGADTMAFNESANAGNFQTARGRYSVTSPANYDETTALPASMGAGTFDANYWHSVFVEYSYPTDLFHGGMRFDNTDEQYLESAATVAPIPNVTVCFWLRIHEFIGVHRILGTDNLFEIELDGNLLINDLYQGGANLYGNTEYIENIWYHVACTRASDNTAQIIVNGVLDTTGTGNSGSPDTDVLMIGNRPGTTDQYLHGDLDDVRIYNRVLSLAEIQTIYACEGCDGIAEDLQHRWFFNEWSEFEATSGSGSVKDLAGTLDLTPVNGPIYGGTRLKFRRRGR